ncbi:uncharacterized protein LOC127702301 [Mytilus californianus]|uniref:uncharacterized protein LOC127702301 n=1 Tax=Mytilus californianus TaxID=6549 RepID=UPI0022481437|nr:uncharacterized protein LOC127702301 [Mytilus californianus]
MYTCYDFGDAILIMDLICVGLSGWFTLTGCLPLCMTVQRKSSCLEKAFPICSIISAVVFSPIVFGLGVAGAIIADFYANASGVVAVSVLLTVLSFIECIVSIVAAVYCCCCCCSQLSTGNHQGVQQGYDQVGNSGMQGYHGNPLNSQQWVYPTSRPADMGYEFPVVNDINSNQRVYPTAPPEDIDQSFPIEDNSTTN